VKRKDEFVIYLFVELLLFLYFSIPKFENRTKNDFGKEILIGV
jgi:hypothetical protein